MVIPTRFFVMLGVKCFLRSTRRTEEIKKKISKRWLTYHFHKERGFRFRSENGVWIILGYNFCIILWFLQHFLRIHLSLEVIFIIAYLISFIFSFIYFDRGEKNNYDQFINEQKNLTADQRTINNTRALLLFFALPAIGILYLIFR